MGIGVLYHVVGLGIATGGVGACGVGALAGVVSECRTLQEFILPRGHGLGQAAGGSIGTSFLARITLMGSVGFSKDGEVPHSGSHKADIVKVAAFTSMAASVAGDIFLLHVAVFTWVAKNSQVGL